MPAKVAALAHRERARSLIPEFSNPRALVRAIQHRLSTGRGALVEIDGHSTSGKTHLSEILADLDQSVALGTDAYADPSRRSGNYPDRLDLKKLAADLANLTKARPRTYIEGICLRDTLARLRLTASLFVYCKRISQAGLWPDDPENYLTSDGQPSNDLSWVDRQSVEYHLRAHPLEHADFVFLRQED